MRKYPLFLLMLLVAAGVSGQGGNSPADKTLRAFSKWYAMDAADSIYGLFNDMMKSKVTADSWRQMFPLVKKMVGNIGAFSLGNKMQGYSVYIAPGSRNSLDMQLALDSTYHIGGLFNRPSPTGASNKHTNYKVATGDGELAGELRIPPSKPGHKPVVALVIAGSGPTDRDGNSTMGSHTDCYRLLTASLDLLGIASLRYDKRFIGESTHFTEKPDSIRFEDYVNDARACIRQLKADTNFSSVVVIGHSEGALIGAIAAHEEKAGGYVSLAGAGVPAEVILRRQLGQGGLDSAGVERALDGLKKGNELYIASWNHYDPAVEIAKLKMPVLIIQGLRDLQVSRQDAEKLEAAAPKGWLVLMDSMNHVLKTAPADRNGNLATYNDPEARLYSDLAPTIEAYIRQPEEEAKGCIYRKWLYKLDTVDRRHFKFVKAAVDSLTTRIKRCNEQFTYPTDYKDAAFEITLPKYLSHITYENGNNHFAICFYDSSYKRAVIVRYDFTEDLKAHTGIEHGTLKIKDKELIFSVYGRNEFVGTLFLEHQIAVSYYSPEHMSEKELQQAVVSFTFK